MKKNTKSDMEKQFEKNEKILKEAFGFDNDVSLKDSLLKKNPPLNKNSKKFNVLCMNLKGGAGKSTNASLLASFFNNSKLIEIDKINKSALSIDSKDYYESIQIDFKNEQSDDFITFENMLFEDGVKIIDVGAVKLEVFHSAMVTNKLYEDIDLIIIPAMDGLDDFIVADKFLNTLKSLNILEPNKVLFSLNRFNDKEYSLEEQFNSFFENIDLLKKDYDIDFYNSHFVIPDRKSIKYAKSNSKPLRFYIDQDDEKLKQIQKSSTNNEERIKTAKLRNIVINAKNLYVEYLQNMITLVNKKMTQA